ncbi:MAG: hypothetical protein GDA40_07040 [Rhodobacteraceae bacterium]|nr:hypothetical protein [Paracoccaceae bacterium]
MFVIRHRELRVLWEGDIFARSQSVADDVQFFLRQAALEKIAIEQKIIAAAIQRLVSVRGRGVISAPSTV